MTLSHRSIAFFASLAAAAIAAAQSPNRSGPPIQRVDFDDGIHLTNGLSAAIERNVAGSDGFGSLIPPNQPRFDRPRLLCGAPRITSYGAGIGADYLWKPGSPETSDGYPFIITYRGGPARLLIHQGLDGWDRYWRDNDESRTWRFERVGANGADLLARQTGADGGTPEIPGWRFHPLFHGKYAFGDLIVVVGTAFKDVNGFWARRGFYVAYTTLDRLKHAGDPWILHAVSAPGPAPHYGVLGAPWATSRAQRPWSDPEPSEWWMGISDYRNLPKDGRHDYVLRIRKVNDEYILDPLVHLESELFQNMHGHSVALLEGDGVMHCVINTGDGSAAAKARLFTYTLGAEYASPEAQPESGIDGHFQAFPRGSGWTDGQTIQHPPGSQIVNVEPWIQPGKAIAAPDLSGDATTILSVKQLAGGEHAAIYEPIDYLPTYQSTFGATNPRGNDGLHVTRRCIVGGDHDRAMVAQDQNVVNDHITKRRIVYSPDGVNFGAFWNTGERSSMPPVISGDRIMIGRVVASAPPMRWSPIPETLLHRPLMLSAAPRNYARQTPLPAASVPAGNTATPLSRSQLLSAVGSSPPAQGGGYHLIWETASSSGRLPLTDAAALPANWSNAVVRFWLYFPSPADDNNVRTSPRLRYSIRAVSAGEPDRDWFGSSNERWTACDRWVPLTIRLENSQLYTSADWQLQLRIYSRDANHFVPMTAYLMVEGIHIDPAHIESVGGPMPTANDSAERATITGFSAGSEWSLLLCGMVPYDSWDDQTPHAPPELTLATLEGASGSHQIIAHRTTRGLALDTAKGNREVGWMRQAPVLALVRRAADGSISADYSAGGSEIGKMHLASGIQHLERITLEESMTWFRIEYIDRMLSDEEAHQSLAALTIISRDCYANCDRSTAEPILTVDDFTCFINEFAQAQSMPPAQQITHYANCDGSTSEPILTVDDFTCFINAFAQGCP